MALKLMGLAVLMNIIALVAMNGKMNTILHQYQQVNQRLDSELN